MTVVAEPVTAVFPASGGNTPAWPLPLAWWQLEQFVAKILAPADPLAAPVIALFIPPDVAAGDAAAGDPADVAAGDAAGDEFVVVVVVVVDEELLLPPLQAAGAIAASATMAMTVTDRFIIPSFLSETLPKVTSSTPLRWNGLRTRLLGGVHGAVRRFDELVRLNAVARIQRRARGYSNAYHRAFDGYRRVGHPHHVLFDFFQDVRCIYGRHQNRELVAAQTCDRVGIAHGHP